MKHGVSCEGATAFTGGRLRRMCCRYTMPPKDVWSFVSVYFGQLADPIVLEDYSGDSLLPRR
jgi:hypothetical protein